MYALCNKQIFLRLGFITFFYKFVCINDAGDFRLVAVSNANNDVRKGRCRHVRVTAGSEMYKEAGKLTLFE